MGYPYIKPRTAMLTDDAFNQEFKPLHIPSAYRANDSWKDKVIFALAELGAGTPADVAGKLLKMDASLDITEAEQQATTILTALFNKGLIKGTQLQHGMLYNLSKILIQNSGSTHPSHNE
ncbi:MAG: hypothetical protein V4592_21210 [Bacteroidota bacterium]